MTPPTSRRLGWALTLVATFTMSISYADRQSFAILAPTITRELDIKDDVLGWLLSAFSFAYLVGAPLGGRFIDAMGARRGLLAAVLTWSAVAALHAVAPSVGVLFALRIALGLAESPSFPGSAQTVHRALPPADRPRGLGVLFTGSSIGAMIVAPLASRLSEGYGWRKATLIVAVMGLVWVPVWVGLSWRRDARAVLDRPHDDAGEPRPSLAALARHPDVIRGLCLVVASAPGIAFLLNWSAKFLDKHHHVPQGEIGSYLWLPPLVFDLGAVLFGDLASRARARLGPARPTRGLVIAGAALASTLALMPFAPTPMSATVIGGVSMAGGGALYALLTADMLSRVPPSSVATAGGISAAVQSISHVVFLPLVGMLSKKTGDYTAAMVVLGLWVVPGTLLWLRLSPDRPTSDLAP